MLFSPEFLIVPVSLTPFGESYTEQIPCLCFHEYETDLIDTSLDNPEIFGDGSSFVWNGKHKAGYAMVTAEQVLETKSLPQGTSAQLACGSDPSSRVKQRAAGEYLH